MSTTDFTTLRAACADKPHGVRARYASGCRCMLCRAANSRYECSRAARENGDWNGVVSAAPARRHLLKLSREGVGYKAVAAACDVSETIINNVLARRRTRIRARSLRAVMAVTKDAKADGARVPAARTWRLLDELIADGYTKAQLARWLGRKVPAIQFKRTSVIARTEARVERMYALVRAGKLRRAG